VQELCRHQVLTREQWLKEAEKCESEGSVRMTVAIVKATVANVRKRIGTVPGSGMRKAQRVSV